jgi:hypothetical protein
MLLPTSDPRWYKLNEFHQQIITTLLPPDGATHCELFLTKNNEVVFLEIAARPSGALVVAMIEHNTGVNIELIHSQLRLQRPFIIQKKLITTFSLFCYIPKKIGTVVTLELPNLKSEVSVTWTIKIGDVISPVALKDNDILFKPTDIAGTIILNNANFESLYTDFLTLKTAQFITTEKE